MNTSHSSILPFLEHPKDSNGHNPILHSVDLQHHIRDVDQISRMSGANFQPSDLPPLPEQFWSSKVKNPPHDPLKAPVGPPMPITLDPTSVALLLRKSTAAICNQSGYHSEQLLYSCCIVYILMSSIRHITASPGHSGRCIGTLSLPT